MDYKLYCVNFEYSEGKKVDVIKGIRALTGMDLKEAKTIADKLYADSSYTAILHGNYEVNGATLNPKHMGFNRETDARHYFEGLGFRLKVAVRSVPESLEAFYQGEHLNDQEMYNLAETTRAAADAVYKLGPRYDIAFRELNRLALDAAQYVKKRMEN